MNADAEPVGVFIMMLGAALMMLSIGRAVAANRDAATWELRLLEQSLLRGERRPAMHTGHRWVLLGS